MTPLLSLVTTCKNRLHHLKQTLPGMVRQLQAEVIVVDYGCQQNTASWVRANYPTVKLVEVTDDPVFCVARARNLGAAEASGKFLCFIDADIVIEGNLGEWIAEHAEGTHYYRADRFRGHSAKGTVCLARKRFEKLGGYDEAFRGWGGEDKDLYERLDFAGLLQGRFPACYLSPIEHGDDERQLGGGSDEMDTIKQSLMVNRLYRAIKQDIVRHTNTLPDLATRKTIMNHLKDQVRQAEAKGRALRRVEIIINPGTDTSSGVNGRRLAYTFQ